MNDIRPSATKCANVLIAGDFAVRGQHSQIERDVAGCLRCDLTQHDRRYVRVLPSAEQVRGFRQRLGELEEVIAQDRGDGLGRVAGLLGTNTDFVPFLGGTLETGAAYRLS